MSRGASQHLRQIHKNFGSIPAKRLHSLKIYDSHECLVSVLCQFFEKIELRQKQIEVKKEKGWKKKKKIDTIPWFGRDHVARDSSGLHALRRRARG